MYFLMLILKHSLISHTGKIVEDQKVIEDQENTEDEENWYEKIANQVEKHRLLFSMSDPEKNPINVMLRVTRRVDDFSNGCMECQEFKGTISTIAQSLDILPNLPPEKRKRPFSKMKPVIKHLQKQHKLVTQNQYASTGLAFGFTGGVCIGLLFGSLLGDPGMGLIIGLIIGIASGMKIGYSQDSKAKKEKKLI